MTPTGDPTPGSDVVAAAGVGIIALDAGCRIASANAAATALLGCVEADLIGRGAHEALNRERPVEACELEEAVRAGVPAHVPEDVFHRADRTIVPVWWAVNPLRDRHTDAVTGAVLVFGDTSSRRAQAIVAAAERDQRHAELAAARSTLADLEWMTGITQALSATLDEHEVLRRLAGLVVGRFGGIAVTDLIHESVLERVGWAAGPGVDVDLDALLRDSTRVPFESGSRTYRTITSAPAVRMSGDQLADPEVCSPATLALFAAVGATEALAVTMTARGRLVGVLGLMRRAGDEPFSVLDEAVAADLCQRAALAVDNARLYRAQTDISSRLQRALLPRIPALPDLRAVVRYLTAKDRFDVGGDWYDVFGCPPVTGTTVLVVGDVAGHDLAAGTTMSALRNLLRGIAVATGRDPAGVLETVDGNLDALGIRGTATTLLMTVTAVSPEAWRLTWSNAGHMPPLVLFPDGTARLVEQVHGPLLGTGLGLTRRQDELTVPAGTTIVLYTDGLVEARGESIDVGLRRLYDTGASLASSIADPDAVADELLARNHASTEDDTAMLVCHLPSVPSRS